MTRDARRPAPTRPDLLPVFLEPPDVPPLPARPLPAAPLHAVPVVDLDALRAVWNDR